MAELDQQLASIFAGLQQNALTPFDEAIGSLEQTLSGLETAPVQADQVPIPPGVSPLAAFGSRFGSTVAEGLGARGASAQNEARLQAADEAIAGAEATNQRNVQIARIQRQKQRLDLLDQIGEAKLERAQQLGDFATLEAETKAAAAREKQRQGFEKEQEEMKIAGRVKVKETESGGGADGLSASERNKMLTTSLAPLVSEGKAAQRELEIALRRPGSDTNKIAELRARATRLRAALAKKTKEEHARIYGRAISDEEAFMLTEQSLAVDEDSTAPIPETVVPDLSKYGGNPGRR
jgi:hypothetical protein